MPARVRGFVYANLRPPKARRCMVNARKLTQLGIGTPEPVACIEYEDYRCPAPKLLRVPLLAARP